MDQSVALEVQVEPLGRHVRGHEDPDRESLLAECLDHLLGPDVRLHTAPVYPGQLILRRWLCEAWRAS